MLKKISRFLRKLYYKNDELQKYFIECEKLEEIDEMEIRLTLLEWQLDDLEKEIKSIKSRQDTFEN